MDKYTLYGIKYSEKAEEYARKERFHRVTKDYVLIYTMSDKLPEEYHIFDKSELSYFSAEDKLWLMECNMQVIIEESAKHTDEIMKNFDERLDRLAAELEKESKANGG